MSLNAMINAVSDKGKMRVDISLMKATSALCQDILKRSHQADYNWDVISLYFTPEDDIYEQKERYDRVDVAFFLTAWQGMAGTTSSMTVARGLQGLEYIVGTTGDGVVSDTTALQREIGAEYLRLGSPLY